MDLMSTLQEKTANANYSAPTPAEKEKAKHADYKNLEFVAKSRWLNVTKVRKYKVVDPITDLSFLEMVIGLEDYDPKKDKQVFLASMNINTKDTPRFYAFIDKEVTRLSHEFRE